MKSEQRGQNVSSSAYGKQVSYFARLRKLLDVPEEKSENLKQYNFLVFEKEELKALKTVYFDGRHFLVFLSTIVDEQRIMSKPKRGFLSLVDDDFWGTGDGSASEKQKPAGRRKSESSAANGDRADDDRFPQDQNSSDALDLSQLHTQYYNQTVQNKKSCDGDNDDEDDVNDKDKNREDGVEGGEDVKATESFELDEDDEEEWCSVKGSSHGRKRDKICDELDENLRKKKDKLDFSDDDEKDLKDSGRESAASVDAYHIRAFLEGPFDVLDEKFFDHYEQVRRGLEEPCASKVVQQLKRPPPSSEPRYRDKSIVVVPHFREPDRRMGRYSKYYYHHNIGPEVYSRKVFVGGLPACVTEDEITMFFSRYGRLHVDWPSKHYPSNLDTSSSSQEQLEPKRRHQHLGYVFLLFERERSVRELVSDCFEEEEGLFINLLNCGGCDTIRVQIRPWLLADAEFLMDINVQVNSKLVAFIGGVPRPLKAVELAHFFEQTYGNVVCVGIDIDNKFKYPRGSGRVAFSNYEAYVQAITDRYIVLDHEDIHKRVEIKPYFFHNQSCEECSGRYHRQHAPYFCPSLECFQYYCEACWHKMHSLPSRFHHMPVVKGV
ncbi:unnamed protein product [Caenorhabditis auriculariae]|uniref:RRM domain-containing protein n=1 Tax=Caenorhabditis auriculariae TaxID=2777116 RepID=A0A8S1HCA4_9PELO|nr:unnamed protein product [Caenorhabditis auriculariae]